MSMGFVFAQQAEVILDEAARVYEKSNGISVQFTAGINSEKQGIIESIEGTILMKGDMFVLITPETHTWYDGSTQWTYISDAEEVYLSTPSGDDLKFTNPMTLLRSYPKDFNLAYKGESPTDTGKPAHNILLTSISSQSDVEKIELQIEKVSSLPAGITVYLKNGIRSLIRIRNMQTGVNPPDSLFTFNPKDYPEVIEIDLR